MEWTYQITAAARPRVLARVVQLFDQQSLVVTSLMLRQNEGGIAIELTAEVEEKLALRLEAKLWHQLDVDHVSLKRFQ